jgi:hypothetical protein
VVCGEGRALSHATPFDQLAKTLGGILLRLESRLFKKPGRTPEEEEFIVAMHSTWKEARAEARALGRDEGLALGEANALLTVLRGRGIPVPDSDRERILAEKDPARIERWIEKAVIATSLAEVLGEPS